MRLFAAVLASLLFVVPSVAQDEGAAEEKAQDKAQAERRVDGLMRGLRRLELSEEQQGKIRALLVEAELAAAKQREGRMDRVAELLTEEQKQAFAERRARMRERGARGRRGGGPGGPGGQLLRRAGLTPEALQRRLELSEEQVQGVGKALKAWGKGLKEKVQGKPRGEEIRALIKQQIAGLRETIAGLLTEEQKAKFAQMNERVDKRMAEGGQRGQRTERGERGERRRGGDPEAVIKRRTEQAMTALGLKGEEAAVIAPLVEKLVRYQVTTGRQLREMREGIAKLAGDEGVEASAIEAKVAAFAAAREQFGAKRERLQSGLRELLTRTQEFRLVGLGILPPVAAEKTGAPDDK